MNSQVTVDVNSLPQDYPSLCIPRVFSNIKWQQVKSTIQDLNLGRVLRVDMVPKTNQKGDKFQRVFIHFKFWDRSEQAQMIRQKLIAGDTIKIVYNDPWYWKISMSHAPKPTFTKNTYKNNDTSTKPRIVFDSHPIASPPVWTSPHSPPPPISIPHSPSIPMSPTLHPITPMAPMAPMAPIPTTPPINQISPSPENTLQHNHSPPKIVRKIIRRKPTIQT